MVLIFGVLFAVFVSLGVWQLERRAWKLDLIETVDNRIHAEPVPAPPPAEWAAVDDDDAVYRHVELTGHYLEGATDSFVQAVTDLGSGYWVLSPFRDDRGFIALINRGFVPRDYRSGEGEAASIAVPSGPQEIAGLLRLTEPDGGFLRSNQPDADRWYSRDVEAIAGARRIEGPVAPYFVDQDRGPPPYSYPVGGMTVVSFRNSHLVYALTWFGLALMSLGGGAYVLRDEWKRRHGGERADAGIDAGIGEGENAGL